MTLFNDYTLLMTAFNKLAADFASTVGYTKETAIAEYLLAAEKQCESQSDEELEQYNYPIEQSMKRFYEPIETQQEVIEGVTLAQMYDQAYRYIDVMSGMDEEFAFIVHRPTVTIFKKDLSGLVNSEGVIFAINLDSVDEPTKELVEQFLDSFAELYGDELEDKCVES